MKKLLFLSILLSLTACKTACVVQDNITNLASGLIFSALQCQNLDAIKADIAPIAAHVGICTADDRKTGLVASLACPILVQGAVAIANGAIPAKWQCNPVNASATVASVLNSGCSALPF